MNKKFRDRTKFLFLKYSVIPILFVIVIFATFVIMILNYKVTLDAKSSAKNIEHKFSEVYNNYTEEIDKLSMDVQVANTLVNHQNINSVYEKFYEFNLEQDVKSAFFLVDKNMILLASTNELKEGSQDKLLNQFIPRIESKLEEITTEVGISNFSHDQISSITFGKPVTNYDGEVLGYIIFKLYVSDLQHLIFGEKSEITVITDNHDHIVVASNEIVQDLMNKFLPKRINKSHVEIKDTSYYMNEKLMAGIPFKVFSLNKNKMDSFTLILLAAFIAFMIATTYFLINSVADKMAKQNSESVEKFLLAISNLKKGKLNSFITIKTDDEFELIANHYNKMLVELNQLIKANKELVELRRENEIKLLQSQFNPHFLFNVLETLRYTIITDLEKSEEIILSLANILRYSSKEMHEKVYLEKDLNYIKDYLKLQKIRFSERLNYQFKVDESVKHALIPKLLIHPMIENAIKYGYYENYRLNIIIEIKKVNDNLIAQIKDNGRGFSKEKLEKIKENLQQTENKLSGTGLYNAHRKIVLNYGPPYGIEIESLAYKQTIISIKIPFNEDE